MSALLSSLWRRANAWNVTTRISLRWPIYLQLSNLLINKTFPSVRQSTQQTLRLFLQFSMFLGNKSARPVNVHGIWRYHGNHILTGRFCFAEKMWLYWGNFEVLDDFSVLSIHYFDSLSDHFWWFSCVFEIVNIFKISDPGWPLFANYDVISTSRDVMRSYFKPQRKPFWTYFIPSGSVIENRSTRGLTKPWPKLMISIWSTHIV